MDIHLRPHAHAALSYEKPRGPALKILIVCQGGYAALKASKRSRFFCREVVFFSVASSGGDVSVDMRP